MTARSSTILAVTALVALSACAKKRPAELPPPPPASNAPTASPYGPGAGARAGNGAVGNAVIPGSRADFLQQVGTDTVHFAFDSSSLDDEAQQILTAQARWLQQHPNVSVTIEGHTDERGTREYNLALGARRANAAKDFLVAHGVSPGRVSTISYGKERPIALGSDEQAWAQNRRAVTVVPE